MGRKLTGDLVRTPFAALKSKKNGFFVGKFIGNRREVKLTKGKGVVYELAIEDTDVAIQKKDETGNYVEATVKTGDTVSVFAPTVLDKALQKAAVGDRVRIIYLGELRNKANTPYHNFDVEVLDAVS